MAATKAVKFRIVGSIPLDSCTLDDATAHIKEVVEKARELGEAKAEISVPRLTGLKV